jgi:hypothetical protein
MGRRVQIWTAAIGAILAGLWLVPGGWILAGGLSDAGGTSDFVLAAIQSP